MQCPYCSEEMELGTLQSRGSNYFLPSGEKRSKRGFYTKKYIEKVNAVPLPPDPSSLFLELEWPVAYCCRGCRKIILNY